jgi:hypothetical protein
VVLDSVSSFPRQVNTVHVVLPHTAFRHCSDLPAMTSRRLYWGVTVGVPMAPRCTPLVTAASGTDLARAVAGELDLLHPCFLIPGRLCVRIVGVIPESAQDDPGGTVETEIRGVGVNAD